MSWYCSRWSSTSAGLPLHARVGPRSLGWAVIDSSLGTHASTNARVCLLINRCLLLQTSLLCRLIKIRSKAKKRSAKFSLCLKVLRATNFDESGGIRVRPIGIAPLISPPIRHPSSRPDVACQPPQSALTRDSHNCNARDDSRSRFYQVELQP